MKRAIAILGRVRRRDGQVLPLMAVCIVALIGMTAIVVDFGRVYVAQQQLQAAVSAAALVAGQTLPNATNAEAAALSYSAAAGEKNAVGGYGVTAAPASVTFECVSHALPYTAGSPPTCQTDTSGTNCQPPSSLPPQPSGVTTCNAVVVTEKATVKTTFGGIFFPSFTVSASATAAAEGGETHPIHAYVILDNTQSITDLCSGTVTGVIIPEKIDCAKAGMQALLQALWPCGPGLPSCGSATANSAAADGTPQLGANVANPVDEVGLLVFPAIKVLSPASSTPVGDEIDCKSTDSFADTYPTWTPYTYSSGATDGGIPSSDDYLGYQAVGLSSDYRPSVTNTTLNTTSNLVEAVDWGQCASGKYPGGNYYGLKVIGGQGSYLAGAITEAQHLLDASAQPGVTNAIIVESDGAMNDPKTFTDTTPCENAVSAAAQAKAAGTIIYSIAYGASTVANSCGPDSPADSYNVADTVMSDIASNSATFYNEPTAGALTADFQQVGSALSDSRLIPVCTQALPAC